MASNTVTVPRGPARIRLCHAAIISVDTLRRVYQGRASENMRERVRRAAIELGLAPPHEAAK